MKRVHKRNPNRAHRLNTKLIHRLSNMKLVRKRNRVHKLNMNRVHNLNTRVRRGERRSPREVSCGLAWSWLNG
jgi:hypothetical protein